jgi:hypothetical protein
VSTDAISAAASTAERLKTLSAFIDHLEKAIGPAFAEFFIEDTKKIRLALLSISVLLLLVTTKIVTVTKLSGDTGIGTKVEYTVSPQFYVALAWITLFLLIVYFARCYVDWQSWLMKKLKADTEIMVILGDITEEVRSNLVAQEGIRTELLELMKNGRYGSRSTELSTKLLKLSSGDETTFRRQREEIFDLMIGNAVKVRKLRIALEIFFPLIFAGSAIYMAISAYRAA